MKYIFTFIALWIFNAIMGVQTENWMVEIYSMVSVGLFYIICILVDIRKAILKGGVPNE